MEGAEVGYFSQGVMIGETGFGAMKRGKYERFPRREGQAGEEFGGRLQGIEADWGHGLVWREVLGDGDGERGQGFAQGSEGGAPAGKRIVADGGLGGA